MQLQVSGVLYYFPFQDGHETLPTEDNPLLARAAEPIPSQAATQQDPTQADGAPMQLLVRSACRAGVPASLGHHMPNAGLWARPARCPAGAWADSVLAQHVKQTVPARV